MHVHHVLAAISDSDTADSVVEFASELAHKQGARITLLHVIEPRPSFPVDGTGRTQAQSFQESLQRAQELLSDMAELVTVQEVQQVIESGSVADVICAEARELGADVVVLGHDTDGQERSMVGSIRDRVKKNCPAPVIVVDRAA